MLSMRLQFALILAVVGLLWLPARSSAQNPQVQEPTLATPPGPLPPAPAEVTSAELVVTYKNGGLTIKARNVQLSDILRRICEQTGAVLDAVSLTDEKVFADLGPGRVKDVLEALLSNSTFNYIMVGSADDPSGLARVLVFPGAKNGNVEVAQVNQPSPSSTLSASNGRKPRDTDSVGTTKDANVAALKQFEALVKAAAAGETVDDTALLQAAAQLGSDASSFAASSPDVDPSAPPPPARPRHRRR